MGLIKPTKQTVAGGGIVLAMERVSCVTEPTTDISMEVNPVIFTATLDFTNTRIKRLFFDEFDSAKHEILFFPTCCYVGNYIPCNFDLDNIIRTSGGIYNVYGTLYRGGFESSGDNESAQMTGFFVLVEKGE